MCFFCVSKELIYMESDWKLFNNKKTKNKKIEREEIKK